MSIQALLLAALLLLAVYSSDAQASCPQGSLKNCSPCSTDRECCQENSVCGCVENYIPGAPASIQGGPARVCRCGIFDLNQCVVANVQRAIALKRAAAVATGQNLDDDKPPPKCVKVPPGKERKVNCTEDSETGNTTSTNTTSAKPASVAAPQVPLK